MGKAARRAAKKQRSAEARRRRIRLEVWPEPREEPVMVRCDGCRIVQVNARVPEGDPRYAFPCSVCGSETATYA